MQIAKPAVRKLLVRNFKGHKIPSEFEAAGWELLRNTLHAIFRNEQPARGFELAYRTCEDLVRCHFGHNLYTRLCAELEGYARTLPATLHERLQASVAEQQAAHVFADLWCTYERQICLIQNVFMYLDRCYTLQKPDLTCAR